jgi:hypothetical protein
MNSNKAAKHESEKNQTLSGNQKKRRIRLSIKFGGNMIFSKINLQGWRVISTRPQTLKRGRYQAPVGN